MVQIHTEQRRNHLTPVILWTVPSMSNDLIYCLLHISWRCKLKIKKVSTVACNSRWQFRGHIARLPTGGESNFGTCLHLWTLTLLARVVSKVKKNNASKIKFAYHESCRSRVAKWIRMQTNILAKCTIRIMEFNGPAGEKILSGGFVYVFSESLFSYVHTLKGGT